MRTKGYKCYNIKCGSCVGKTLCGEPADTALGCANRMVNVMTNADRIRAMSDTELAEELRYPTVCKNEKSNAWKCSEYGCKDCLLAWLQEPCGGADHEAL